MFGISFDGSLAICEDPGRAWLAIASMEIYDIPNCVSGDVVHQYYG